MDNIKFLPGQLVEITTNSGNVCDIYESKLLSMDQNYLEITQPSKSGVFSTIPTGYNLSLKTNTPYGLIQFNSKVVGKNPENNSLFISLPQDLTNAINTTIGSNAMMKKACKFVTITSGKGGTGKSCFAINFAISLAKRNKKVVLLDADLGMANIDVLLKLSPVYNLTDVIRGAKTLEEVIIDGPGDIKVIPGGNGLFELSNLSPQQIQKITEGLTALEKDFDYILIDTSAGLSPVLNDLVIYTHETILVTTPEPHAISDTFSILKVLISRHHCLNLKLVVNKCESPQEGESVTKRISGVIGRFPNCTFSSLGYIPESILVSKSVKNQSSFLITYPESDVAECIESVVDVELGEPRKVKVIDKNQNEKVINPFPGVPGTENQGAEKPFLPVRENSSSTFVSRLKDLFNKA
ncbi:MAG TPA: AAA family ATPase [Pseudobacteroides sp.]|uniref:AAA family ATPase n=1 Tax=Pseudobacteroides sp. TaxID=1968840 RepID=UPI002F937E77